MVEELGVAPRKKRISKTNREGQESPGTKEWKNAMTLGEVTAKQAYMQEGRLPPIVEDKYYPRRTMEYVPTKVHPQYVD